MHTVHFMVSNSLTPLVFHVIVLHELPNHRKHCALMIQFLNKVLVHTVYNIKVDKFVFLF